MASTIELSSADESPSQQFFKYFQLEATALQHQMARLEHLSPVGGERLDAIDHCLSGISRLQKEVQDASSYTTTYDQKMYSGGIKALHERLSETRAALAPKAKFSFKSLKKNNSAISLNDAAELAIQQYARLAKSGQFSSQESSLAPTPLRSSSPPSEVSDKPAGSLRRDSLGSFLTAAGVESPRESGLSQRGGVRETSMGSSNEVNIRSHSGVHIILPSSGAHATSSGSLTNLRRCIVDVSVPTSTTQPFAGLTVNDAKGSLLICGSVSGAAHVTRVENSIILVAAQQFRMHDCNNCIVYLHVSSDPIIEDCSEVRFAPLPKPYSKLDRSSTPKTNHFDKVQDFKWLKSEPSPNWRVLSAEESVPEDIWDKIAESGNMWALDDILRASGVTRLTD